MFGVRGLAFTEFFALFMQGRLELTRLFKLFFVYSLLRV